MRINRICLALLSLVIFASMNVLEAEETIKKPPKNQTLKKPEASVIQKKKVSAEKEKGVELGDTGVKVYASGAVSTIALSDQGPCQSSGSSPFFAAPYNMPLVPYKGAKKQFIAGAQASHFALNAEKKMGARLLKAYIQGDFQGGAGVYSYSARLKRAYVQYEDPHWFIRAGQDVSAFFDQDSDMPVVDQNGLLPYFFVPVLCAAYTVETSKQSKFRLTLSAEQPTTDYQIVNEFSVVTNNGFGLRGAPISRGISSIPDGAIALRETFTNPDAGDSHLEVRGIFRQLRIDKNLSLSVNGEIMPVPGAADSYGPVAPVGPDDPYPPAVKDRFFGYGVGISSKISLTKNHYVFGQFIIGNGLGLYIPMFAGNALVINDKLRAARQRSFEAIGGVHLGLTEKLSFNVGSCYDRLGKISAVVYKDVDHYMRDYAYIRTFANFMYQVTKEFNLGLEVLVSSRYAKQLASNVKKNRCTRGTRISIGAFYKF